ncbi:Nudix hydrolase 16, mitochondrial [Ancistrocladus abbreviatus]
MMGTVGGDKEGGIERQMSELVARTGRLQQRYEDGCRLVSGCIPFRYRSSAESDGESDDKIVEVLMISSTSGPGLLFPKGGWENDETVQQAAIREAIEEAGVKGVLLGQLGGYDFKSKTLQDEFCPEGKCRAVMFALHVKEELQSWPEQSTRQRSWLTIPEALECCRHNWMRKALEEGFMKWRANHMNGPANEVVEQQDENVELDPSPSPK